MNLYNATPFAAAYSLGIQKSGRSCLVIVAKATYNLPDAQQPQPKLADEQIAPFETDSYTGEPGLSAPLYENDFATFKPRCDVILHGSAYSQQPVTERQIGIKVGNLEKLFKVIGARHFDKVTRDNALQLSTTKPFTKQKISYDTAYGGSEATGQVDENGEPLFETFAANPVGIGYSPTCPHQDLIGKLLSQSEELTEPVASRKSKMYKPQSFGPIARNWYPRYQLAGTYDKNWLDNIKPFLPEDFDEAYYQCAPPDQQVPYLRGGEVIALYGLTPEDKTSFYLPKNEVPMQAILTNGERYNLSPVIDTLIIEPDEKRFTLVWRSRIALKRNIHEIETLIVGKPTGGWERARLVDKRYLPLGKLNDFKKEMQSLIAEEQRLQALEDNDSNKDEE